MPNYIKLDKNDPLQKCVSLSHSLWVTKVKLNTKDLTMSVTLRTAIKLLISDRFSFMFTKYLKYRANIGLII
jgi:hypothetical protein